MVQQRKKWVTKTKSIYVLLTCTYLGHIPKFDLLMLFVKQCWWLPTQVRDLEQTPGSSFSSSALWRCVDQHGHSSACQKTSVPVAALQERTH